MSCNTFIPIMDLVREVEALLAANYIDKDDPRITGGVFTNPTIKEGFLLDVQAREEFCRLVQECGLDAPFGKMWLSRPLYPDSMFVSYEDSGEPQTKWKTIQAVLESAGVFGPAATSLSSRLAAEIGRATAAENGITLRAKAADADIAANKAGISANATAISAENSRAVTAEGALTSAVDVLKLTDLALQSQVNSIGGGKKAYTTYALMVADKDNIDPNSSIDVANDPDPTKNGTYSYDGAVFTKSIYDAEAVVRSKVLNTFKTKSLMEASTLLNGADAQVTDDSVADNNGLYAKTAGAWIKSAYDPVELLDERVRYNDNRDILNVISSENRKALSQLDNGDIVAPKIGNITKFINETRVSARFNNRVDVDAIAFAGKYADYQIADNCEPFFQDFLISNPQKVNDANIGSALVATHMRISSFVRLSQYEFLVFHSAGYSSSDFGAEGMPGGKKVSVKITVDPITKTIVADTPKLVHEGSIKDGNPYSWGSMSAVKLASGRIVMLVGTRAGSNFHEIFSLYSDNDGDTWSDPVDISHLKNDLGWNVVAFTFKGLVKRYGQHVGRIIVPMWTTQAGYSPFNYRSGYMYSDDDGETWNIGELLDIQTSNECTVCEELNGDLFFNIRVENAASDDVSFRLYNKFFARHCDITKKYTLLDTARGLSVERIMAGVYQGDNIYDHTPNKILFSTCLTAQRKGLGVHTSYDRGMTWTQYRPTTMANKYVAYSDITSITPELVMVVYETAYSNEIRACLISTYNLINGES